MERFLMLKLIVCLNKHKIKEKISNTVKIYKILNKYNKLLKSNKK